MDRRSFIKSGAGGGLATAILSRNANSSTKGFAINQFIEQNPDAVFIMRSNAANKFDTDAKDRAGLELASTLFSVVKSGGTPLSRPVAIKTNTILGKAEAPYPEGYLMGAHTDPAFTGGFVKGMKAMGMSGGQFTIRDASCHMNTYEDSGYLAMAEKTGVTLRETADVNDNPEEVHWVNIPNGIIHRRLPYLLPYNTKNTYLINIAKFKSHAMGITLCCKNLQGTIANPYKGFCGGLKGIKGRCADETLNPDFIEAVMENYQRHKKHIPRWDKPGHHYDCGIGMETWVTRTLDNLSASTAKIHIVEGIYGRDGSHINGPHPPYEKDRKVLGRTKDFMSNIVMFGKNPYHIDNIGHWLGGHEPGNFGLFHIALERGLARHLDPHDIPLYIWENGRATEIDLTSLERTPLLSYYLRRDYDGQHEDIYHLCDEAFDYGPNKG